MTMNEVSSNNEVKDRMIVSRRTFVKPDEGGYEIGDIISFNLATGEYVTFMAMKINDDGSALFVAKNCIDEDRKMNTSNTTEGGYEASAMRKYLNRKLLAVFPEGIRSRMQPMEYGDHIRLLKYDELFDEDSDSYLAPMRDRRNRIALSPEDDDWTWYWLQDVRSSAAFAAVSGTGSAYSTNASNALGIRPAITLI